MLTHKHAQPDLMYMPYKINIKSVNYNLISPFSAALNVVRFALTLSLCSSLLLLLSLPLYFPMFRFVIQLLVALGSDVCNLLPCNIVGLFVLSSSSSSSSSFSSSSSSIYACSFVCSFSGILYHSVLIFFSVDACTLALGRTLIIFYICVASACTLFFSLRFVYFSFIMRYFWAEFGSTTDFHLASLSVYNI